MKRSAKVQQAEHLYVYGDRLTGSRVTSLTRLSAMCGVGLGHLSNVRQEDEWDRKAEERAKNTGVVSFGTDPEEIERQVLSDRARALKALELAREKLDKAVEGGKEELISKLEDRWDKARERYYNLAGINTMIVADRTMKVELAKLKAKAAMQEPPSDDGGGKIVAV